MEYHVFVSLVIIALPEICRSSSLAPGWQEKQTHLLDQLLEKYDSRLRPTGRNGTDGAVHVTLGVDLLAINTVSDYDQEIGVRVSLVQEWTDDRLKYLSDGGMQYVILMDTSRIWAPDLYFMNEKDAELHRLMKPNSFIRIYPSGLVHYSSRVSLSLWCNMQLERFPFDYQVCGIQMASYAYTAQELHLRWRNASPVTGPTTRQADVMGFTLRSVKAYSSGETVEVRLLFKRDLQYYTLHTFLPSAVIVAVSWLTLWVVHRAATVRALVALSSLFAMSCLTTDVEATVPHVPYMKAMDLWTAVCFLFILATLLVNTNAARERWAGVESDKAISVNLKPLARKSLDSSQAPEKTTPEPSSTSYRLLTNIPRGSEHIESLARILLPCCFGVFAALYFIVQCVLYSPMELE